MGVARWSVYANDPFLGKIFETDRENPHKGISVFSVWTQCGLLSPQSLANFLFFWAFCIISDFMAAIFDFIFSSNLGKQFFSQKLPMSCCFFSLDIGEDI
jgi:hypothetical protein